MSEEQLSLPLEAIAYLNSLLERDVSEAPISEVRSAVADYAAARLRDSRHRGILELADGGRLLDIGCDIGVLAKALSPRARTVLGIDMRPETIAIARTFFRAPNVEYRTSMVSELHIEAGAFDTVLLLETIEHVEDPVAVLSGIRGMLRPGGTLIISTPNAVSYLEIVRQVARLWPSLRTDGRLRHLFAGIGSEVPGSGTQEDHLYSWTWETLYRLAHRVGFRYVDHRRAGFWPPSVPLGAHRLRPFGRSELTLLRPLVGPLCQTLVLKLQAVA